MASRLEKRQIKVCPVVLQNSDSDLEILLFRHPLAGVQIVKGTLEKSDESIELAALRELAEESGILGVRRTEPLSAWESGYQNQLWHLVRCECMQLPRRWAFYTLDDGGHDFEFFWHKLNKPIPFECHDVFIRAISHIRELCLS